ncbi:MAG: YncE family protein, partial [Actinobacteria bacterium]|nr:YncE family protein [Actinomycetota bacterium]
MFVASEGNDHIALVRYGPGGARVERDRKIGTNPTELVGPHGIYVSPDGKWYYVTTAHGAPNGALWKFSAETGEQVGRVELGRFPATLQVSPDGHYAWVVNFNLYGDMVPSSVSVVYTGDMLEVRRIPTCVMPHGSRLSPDGRHQYSACMMNDELVEIAADSLAVSRHFMLKPGAERGMSGPPAAMAIAKPGGPHSDAPGGGGGHDMAPPKAADVG